jgi:exodeoxyribonuclease III
VQTWMTDVNPDVLALQEIKMPTEDFPHEAFCEMGYQAAVSGQRTYNGVAILSKKDAADVVTDIYGLDDPQRRVLGVTIQGIRVLNLYIPNGESVGSEKYKYKLNWLEKLHDFLKSQLKQYPKMIILGDFNIAPKDIDVYDPKAWENSVLFSEPERDAFQNMLKLGFKDCFRALAPDEQSYSWWDYRMNAFRRKMGLRIDHILASDALFPECSSCHIDPAPRKWERPSDHAPVVAEFKLT